MPIASAVGIFENRRWDFVEKRNAVIDELMDQRFGHDSLIALATVENGEPFVQTVNA